MTVYLELKRLEFAKIVQKAQHMIGGLPLLYLGVAKLREGEELPIAALEIAISVIVIGTFLMELRAMRDRHRHAGHVHQHARVGWFDLAAGVLQVYEAFHGAHHKPGYLRPPFFSGVITIALGLFHRRFDQLASRRRYLTLDENGVEWRVSRFRRFRAAWAELERIEVAPDRALFLGRDGGRHTLKLGGLHNREKVREFIESEARTAGLLEAPRP